MNTRSMNLAPNGRCNNKQDDHTSNGEVARKTTLANIQEDMKAALVEQTEVKIPKLEKEYADKTITTDEYNEGYDRMIKEMLDLQTKMKEMKKQILNQDKKIEDISINMKIQDNANKDTFACIEKDTKYGLKENTVTRSSRDSDEGNTDNNFCDDLVDTEVSRLSREKPNPGDKKSKKEDMLKSDTTDASASTPAHKGGNGVYTGLGNDAADANSNDNLQKMLVDNTRDGNSHEVCNGRVVLMDIIHDNNTADTNINYNSQETLVDNDAGDERGTRDCDRKESLMEITPIEILHDRTQKAHLKAGINHDDNIYHDAVNKDENIDGRFINNSQRYYQWERQTHNVNSTRSHNKRSFNGRNYHHRSGRPGCHDQYENNQDINHNKNRRDHMTHHIGEDIMLMTNFVRKSIQLMTKIDVNHMAIYPH